MEEEKSLVVENIRMIDAEMNKDKNFDARYGEELIRLVMELRRISVFEELKRVD